MVIEIVHIIQVILYLSVMMMTMTTIMMMNRCIKHRGETEEIRSTVKTNESAKFSFFDEKTKFTILNETWAKIRNLDEILD